MKTIRDLEKENDLLRQRIEHLQEMQLHWQNAIADFKNVIREYQRELGIEPARTLRIVR